MVIDTGIFIDFLRAKDKSKTILFALRGDTEIYISSITVFELFAGATNTDKRRDLQILIGDLPTLSFSPEVAKLAAEIHQKLKRSNKLIEIRDLFIAATALKHNQPLLTKNIKHFSRIEQLTLVDL